MEKTETWARQHSIDEIRLRTHATHEEARQFYAAIGYETNKHQFIFRKALQ